MNEVIFKIYKWEPQLQPCISMKCLKCWFFFPRVSVWNSKGIRKESVKSWSSLIEMQSGSEFPTAVNALKPCAWWGFGKVIWLETPITLFNKWFPELIPELAHQEAPWVSKAKARAWVLMREREENNRAVAAWIWIRLKWTTPEAHINCDMGKIWC